jgi:hypothetical protein
VWWSTCGQQCCPALQDAVSGTLGALVCPMTQQHCWRGCVVVSRSTHICTPSPWVPPCGSFCCQCLRNAFRAALCCMQPSDSSSCLWGAGTTAGAQFHSSGHNWWCADGLTEVLDECFRDSYAHLCMFWCDQCRNPVGPQHSIAVCLHTAAAAAAAAAVV